MERPVSIGYLYLAGWWVTGFIGALFVGFLLKSM